MEKHINACGLSCPQPVLLVLECIKKEQPAALHVLVDNDAARENVTRAAQNRGYAVQAVAAEGADPAGSVRLHCVKETS